jgi:hypothetical protein
MFRATPCSSSGESIVSVQHLVCVTLCRWPSFPTCILDGHLHRVTHTRCCIDTIDSPDDEHRVAWNMLRIEINRKKELCIKLVIYKNYTKMHGQQNIKYQKFSSDCLKNCKLYHTMHWHFDICSITVRFETRKCHILSWYKCQEWKSYLSIKALKKFIIVCVIHEPHHIRN